MTTYSPGFDDNMLQALADELARVVKRTDKKVDAALAQLESFERFFAETADRGAAARPELEASGVTWPFDPAESDADGKTADR